MKRNRFVNFLLSLEEEMTLGKYRVQKKFVVIGVLGIGIYLFMTLYNSNSPRMGILGKNGNKEYNELMSEQEKIAEDANNQPPSQVKPEEVKTYEQNMKEILSMSDDEIRELLKSQNMYLSDEDIAKFREDVRKNMPKTQEEAMKNAEEFKNFEETTMKQVYEEAKKMAEEETKKKGE